MFSGKTPDWMVQIPAASVELLFSFVVLLVTPIAVVLGHASPPLAGWAVALASVPIVFAADALEKRVRVARRASGADHSRPRPGETVDATRVRR